ncbi:hypothetical protein MMC08_004455 [Hypocenomyce scalaris]|nr:hypothetical protein [Hypocenomyce scalaris]
MVDEPIPKRAPSTQDAINIIHTAHTTANNGPSIPSPPPPPGKPKIPQSASNPIKATATLSPPLGQFFLNTILQIAAFVAAIAFGVFAVKSVKIANAANAYAARALEEARVANQVAMLSIRWSPFIKCPLWSVAQP